MDRWNGLPLVIFGSGGISREVFSLIKRINSTCTFPIFDFIGFVEYEEDKIGAEVIDCFKVVTCDAKFHEFTKKYKKIGAVIPLGDAKLRMRIFNAIKEIESVVFPNIISLDSKLNIGRVELGMGNVIFPQCSVRDEVKIGNFNLLIGHAEMSTNVRIGDFNSINALSKIQSHVTIGNNNLIGTGAVIKEAIMVGDGTSVGMGSYVIKDVENNTSVFGTPARRYK